MQPCAGVMLDVRPFLSGRDHHALHHENPVFRFDAACRRGTSRVDAVPGGCRASSRSRTADYTHAPDWYRHFQYDEERARGLDDTEDLASPGTFRWDLSGADAVWMLAADRPSPEPAGAALPRRTDAGHSRRAGATPNAAIGRGARLLRSADAYVVRRGAGKSIIAGLSVVHRLGPRHLHRLRGLCLATGRLTTRAPSSSDGRHGIRRHAAELRFPERANAPPTTRSMPPLWFIIAVHDFTRRGTVALGDRRSPNRRRRSGCRRRDPRRLSRRHPARYPLRWRRPAGGR